jgi:hypothetical protein
MPKFVIEREIPGAGNLTDAELREISQRSLGFSDRWVRRTSGSTATSPATSCIAFTLFRTKLRSKSMPGA